MKKLVALLFGAQIGNSTWGCPISSGTSWKFYIVNSAAGQKMNGGSWHNGGVAVSNTVQCPIPA